MAPAATQRRLWARCPLLARRQLQTPSWFDQKIDEMLASERFLHAPNDRTEPNVIAVRILGELFGANPSGDNKPEFFRQIRRVLPTRSDAEFQELHRYALNEWVEAYGF